MDRKRRTGQDGHERGDSKPSPALPRPRLVDQELVLVVWWRRDDAHRREVRCLSGPAGFQ